MLRIVLILLWLSATISETFKDSNELFIYHLSPVLRVPIHGTDSHSLLNDLKLEIGAADQNPLRVNVDYTISPGDGELILQLKKGQIWADTSDEEKTYPIPLILKSATMGTNVKTNLLSKAVVLAQVLPTPFVGGNAAQIDCFKNQNISVLTYSTIGAKTVELEFKTSLKRHIDYELTSPLPLQFFRLNLMLKEGRCWKTADAENNEVRVMSIDTGAGPWAVGAGKGVVVACMECPQDYRSRIVAPVASDTKAAAPGEVLTVYSSTKTKTTPVATKDIEWVVQEAPKKVQQLRGASAVASTTEDESAKIKGDLVDSALHALEALEEYIPIEQPKVKAVHLEATSMKGTLQQDSFGRAPPEYVLTLPRTTAALSKMKPDTGLSAAASTAPAAGPSITVFPTPDQVVYDNSPRVSIQGLGFGEVPIENILLTLGDRERSQLTHEVDYIATRSHESSGLTLYLLHNKQWGFMTDASPPQFLTLSSVKVVTNAHSGGASMAIAAAPNLLAESVTIAKVLAVPGVIASSTVHDMSEPMLNITVTGCNGAKSVGLSFFPPLTPFMDYDDITHYPLFSADGVSTITLKLRRHRKWKQLPGFLVVRAIDSGAGKVRVGERGHIVAVINNSVVPSSGKHLRK